LLLFVTLAAGCSSEDPVTARANEAPAPAREVRTMRVVEESLTRLVTVTGTLAAEEEVALAFKVPGRVDSLRVDLGSLVREGQIVATLVPTDYELRVRQAEAALQQARVRLGLAAEGVEGTVDPEGTPLVRQRRAVVNEARLNRDRMRTIFDRGLIARATLDAAEASLEVAEGQYEDALEEIRTREGVLAQRRSELEIARQQLQDTVLRAPMTGAVRERQGSIGEYRAAGTPVLHLVRTHPLRLKLAVPERETAALRVGQPVRVRLEGDARRHDGRLARIGAAIDEANRTLPIEAVVPNPRDELRPGQFATAEVVVSEDDPGLVVPQDAIVTFAGIQKVLTVKDGHAREQRVRLGRRSGERVEVTEGIQAGDVVIREPGDLVDGVAVRVVTAE
jgi:RND family efflux transporter MFP subunit